jgi:YHS domain-containing protein
MKKHLLLFAAAFALGTVAALAARSAWFKPYENHPAAEPAAEYGPMVANPLTPASQPAADKNKPSSPPATPAEPHAGHETSAPAKSVNTVCPICGMDVDPSLKPATYQGKLVGFGCRMCPPKFARDPDRYGPAALENKVVSD